MADRPLTDLDLDRVLPGAEFALGVTCPPDDGYRGIDRAAYPMFSSKVQAATRGITRDDLQRWMDDEYQRFLRGDPAVEGAGRGAVS